jgi:very-short-patch-repair endonuclease
MDARRPRYIGYRRNLKSRARNLRRDPTFAERKLWYEFLSRHSEKFTRQKPLGTYIADFYCAQKQLVIEVDGDSHFTAEGDAYDRRRTGALGVHRIHVLRFTNGEVMHEFDAVCARIDAVLRSSAEQPPEP